MDGKALEVVEQSGEDVTVKSEPKPIKVKRCDLKNMLREGDEVTTTEGEYGRVSSQLQWELESKSFSRTVCGNVSGVVSTTGFGLRRPSSASRTIGSSACPSARKACLARTKFER
jgi:hypothetical protein